MILVAAFIAVPALATAQEPVRDFSQLNTRLKPGDTIWVTDAQGRETKGRILSLGADALTQEGAGDRTFGPPDVTRIEVRRPDSLKNGALIGLGVGAGFGAVTCAALAEREGDAGWCVLAAGVWGGLGAGAGVGIDVLIPGPKLVAYRAPGSAGPSRARLSIAPAVTPRAKAVAVSVSF
jgi:hypothetical protein